MAFDLKINNSIISYVPNKYLNTYLRVLHLGLPFYGLRSQCEYYVLWCGVDLAYALLITPYISRPFIGYYPNVNFHRSMASHCQHKLISEFRRFRAS